MMGLGRKGGYRPKQWQWKWDPARSNNQLWIGDVNAGLSCKLKHTEDRWDLFNLQESGVYKDWASGGQGGCAVEEVGSDQVVIRAYTGPREVAAGQELHFNFGLLITPVKPLDKSHWQWRYFHRSTAAPVAEAAASGATVINLHQGDGLNPNINYPFLTTDKLAAYAAEAHARKMQVKIYYTIRELSNYTAEFWALRSLGGEIFTTGPGFRLADQFADKPAAPRGPTGSAWLCEHAVTGYVPAWHQPLGNGHYDAAIATTGLSRWHNYYLEGLNWLVRHVGIDGLYLDGIGYDREIMKRVRKVLQRARPGCLIDFHSGNHFHPQYGLNNCANLYIELFPCIDSLWFGEGFDYNEPPDYWMVEMAGIPYGLFGEMLHGGGNPWRGMVYGMTNRLGWSGDPRGLWKLWDDFGIARARMIGYWDPACPVKTGREDVLATVYQREGRTLVAIASWAPAPVSVKLAIDFQRLGLDPAKAHLYGPPVPRVQGEVLFEPGDAIPVAPGRGWLLVLDEQTRQVAKAVDLCAGRKVLLEDSLAGDQLARDWTATHSKQPGTAIRPGGGELRIEGAANVAAYVERTSRPGAAGRLPHRPADRRRGVLGPGPDTRLAGRQGPAGQPAGRGPLRRGRRPAADPGRDEPAQHVDAIGRAAGGQRGRRSGFAGPAGLAGTARFPVPNSRAIRWPCVWARSPGSKNEAFQHARPARHVCRQRIPVWSRIRLEDKEVVVQASQDQQAWQELARFPRSEFAGDPLAVRLGKLSPGSKNEDFSTLGPPAHVCRQGLPRAGTPAARVAVNGAGLFRAPIQTQRLGLARTIHGPVAAFARTRDGSASYARVLANAATTVRLTPAFWRTRLRQCDLRRRSGERGYDSATPFPAS